MSTNKIVCQINKRKSDGTEIYEGVVTVYGLLPTKLTKAKTSETRFNTKSSLTSSAKSLAKRLGLEVEFVEKTTAKSATKVAKKKTVKSQVFEAASVPGATV